MAVCAIVNTFKKILVLSQCSVSHTIDTVSQHCLLESLTEASEEI
jgi:hypothetical protein